MKSIKDSTKLEPRAVHVRLQGTPEDVAVVLAQIQDLLTIQDISAEYPDRNNPNSVRRYMTVLFLATKGG
ncbi:MAG TPA: hypothetical protein PKM01_04440 [Anaerolineaceae bacterium]|nr:hypothetical protein [Anaerolineaceae bacterium]